MNYLRNIKSNIIGTINLLIALVMAFVITSCDNNIEPHLPPQPTITSFLPSRIKVGTIVTIGGTRLTGTISVMFNGVEAKTITDIKENSLKATVPVGATSGKITIRTYEGTATSSWNFTSNDTNAAMVWVPGGTFTMGNSDGMGHSFEYPAHQVTLTGFYIYKYEVTVAQYREFCNATGTNMPSFPSGLSWDGKSGWTDPSLQQHPIVNVSWYDSSNYAYWAGARLPTEAQWEYAARGPQGRNYPWGGTTSLNFLFDGWSSAKCANNNTSKHQSTWPVGSFPAGASWCGAEDMAGNVWEWCEDQWSDNYSSLPSSGSNRILRGGCWDYYSPDPYRTTYRDSFYPGSYDNLTGFRCIVTTQ
jgi:formylglycine-generating enzyme required for sulfatase activity